MRFAGSVAAQRVLSPVEGCVLSPVEGPLPRGARGVSPRQTSSSPLLERSDAIAMHSKRSKLSPPPPPLAPLYRIRSYAAGFNLRCLQPPSSARVARITALRSCTVRSPAARPERRRRLHPERRRRVHPEPVEGPIREEPEACPRGKPRHLLFLSEAMQ